MKLTLPGLCVLILSTAAIRASLYAFEQASRWPSLHPEGGALSRQGAHPKLLGMTSDRAAGEQRAHRLQPKWVKHVGCLRLVKWGDGGDPSSDGRETLILRDALGRTVARITGHYAHVEWVGDLTGDGIPDVVLHAFEGVTHAGNVYYVYSAGPQPRCLLAYDKQNVAEDAGLWPEFRVEDLDGDGHPEIVTTYDGFAYWNEVERWQTCYYGSARVPLVLGFRRGRVVDVTTEYRPWLRVRLAQAKQRFVEDLHAAGERGPSDEHTQGMIEYYSIGLLLHGPIVARRMVVRLLPRNERPFFLQNSGLIEKVVADRWSRYAYPSVYSGVQAFASDAFVPRDP